MELHFIRPWWWLALIPMAFLLWRLLRQKSQKGVWSQVIAPEFQTLLLSQNAENTPKHWPIIGLGILWFATITALSGPAWKQVKMPAETSLQGNVIVLDLSLSMLADDLKPNRLSRAQFKLRDLLKQHPELSVGMVVYAGSAHTLVPISQDNQTLLSLLPNLSPTMMPLYGSDPIQGFKLAKSLLDGAQIKQGHLIWVTDDVDDAQLPAIQAFFAENDISLAIYAVGSELGGPVHIPDFGLLKDEQGRIVLPKVPLQRLETLANQLDSPLQPLSLNNSDIDQLLPPTLLTTQTHQKAGEQSHAATENPYIDAWIEEGLMLLWLLVPLAALGFRRGWLLSWLVLPLSFSLLNPIQPLYADEPVPPTTEPVKKAFMPELLTGKKDPDLSFGDAFITPDRQGYLLWEKQDYARAETRFESPAWKGASLYRLGQYAKAAQQFALDKSAQGYYNLGNALAKQGQFEQAKTAYESALQKQPEMSAAQDNLKIIEQLLKKPEKSGEPQGNNAQQPKSEQSNPQDAEQGAGQNNQPSNDLQTDNSTDPRDKNAQQHAKQTAGQTPQKNAQQNSEQSQSSDQAQQQGNSDASKDGQNTGQAGGQQAAPNLKQDKVQASDTQQSLQGSDESGEQPSKLGEQSDNPAQDLTQEALKAQGLAGQAIEQGKTEQQQATQTWLNQIPDEPQLFLKRKFDYQYQQQAPARNPNAAQKIW